MYPGSTAAQVPYSTSPAAERSAGRVEMARRRIENIRERLVSALVGMSNELDRLGGPVPSEAKVGQGVPPKPTGELFALDAEADSLEGAFNFAEQIAARLRNV